MPYGHSCSFGTDYDISSAFAIAAEMRAHWLVSSLSGGGLHS